MNHQKNDSPYPSGLSRRQFFTTSSLALGAAGLGAVSRQSVALAGQAWPPPPNSLLKPGDVVLFQGDSITDAGRDQARTGAVNDQAALGNGYAWLAAVELLVGHPLSNYSVFNRGISGNKVFQLAERWPADCLNLNPNLVSILIGVNDLWHTLSGNYNGTVEIYERDYRDLLERTRKALPKAKLVICEPFVLRCGAVNEKWFPEFDRYCAAARRIADSFHATFIPFQSMFNEAVKYAPPTHWAQDGVHPTGAGAALMAHNWLRIVAGK